MKRFIPIAFVSCVFLTACFKEVKHVPVSVHPDDVMEERKILNEWSIYSNTLYGYQISYPGDATVEAVTDSIFGEEKVGACIAIRIGDAFIFIAGHDSVSPCGVPTGVAMPLLPATEHVLFNGAAHEAPGFRADLAASIEDLKERGIDTLGMENDPETTDEWFTVNFEEGAVRHVHFGIRADRLLSEEEYNEARKTLYRSLGTLKINQ